MCDQQQQTEYDTRDPEVPIVLAAASPDTDTVHPCEEKYRTKDYVAPALHGLRSTIIWAWENICTNERLWIVLATIVIAVATSLYTYYARKHTTHGNNGRRCEGNLMTAKRYSELK
jgi:hypothetical protein